MVHLRNALNETMVACQQKYFCLFEDSYLILFSQICHIPVIHTNLLLVNPSANVLADIIFELFNHRLGNKIIATKYVLVSVARAI
jgi:hypothetical protein